MIASQLSGHCDVISNRLWHHQNENQASETWGWCVKIVGFIVIYGFVMSCKKWNNVCTLMTNCFCTKLTLLGKLKQYVTRVYTLFPILSIVCHLLVFINCSEVPEILTCWMDFDCVECFLGLWCLTPVLNQSTLISVITCWMGVQWSEHACLTGTLIALSVFGSVVPYSSAESIDVNFSHNMLNGRAVIGACMSYRDFDCVECFWVCGALLQCWINRR